jgi:hypothetical protein
VPPAKKGLSADARLAIGLGVCAALIVVALAGSRFWGSAPPPPPPPPPPPSTAATVEGILRFTPGFYKAQLEDDAKTYGVAPISVDALAQPNAYSLDLATPRTLKDKHGVLETAHLRLATTVKKEWATTPSGQGFRYEHLILEITNKTQRPLAYHVVTAVAHPEKCRSMGAMTHDAIAIAPGETIERTECLWHPHAKLTVKKVEVLELSPLGYYYVSRLQPSQVLLEERTSLGHAPPKGKVCSFAPWREIHDAQATGTSWADVMDFYSRHDCDQYSFWRGYRRWTTPGTLPSRAPPAKPTVAAAPPTP